MLGSHAFLYPALSGVWRRPLVQRRAFHDVDWQSVIVEGLMERFDVSLMWYGDEDGLVLFGILKSVQRQKGHQLAYGI